MRYDFAKYDVLQIRDGRNWWDFSTLTNEADACNAYALVYRGEWEGAPAEFRIIDASKAITKCETRAERPNGAPPMCVPERVSEYRASAHRSHGAWLSTVDRLTRRWAHDVFTHGGAAMLVVLADVNAERVAAGLSPLTIEEI